MTSTIGHKDDEADEDDADNDDNADADNNDNADADKDADADNDDNDDDDSECHLRLGETKSTAEPPAESANTWKEPRDSKCESVKV